MKPNLNTRSARFSNLLHWTINHKLGLSPTLMCTESISRESWQNEDNSTICIKTKDPASLTSCQVSQYCWPLAYHYLTTSQSQTILFLWPLLLFLTLSPHPDLCDQLMKISKDNENGLTPPQTLSSGLWATQVIRIYLLTNETASFSWAQSFPTRPVPRLLTVFVKLSVLKSTTTHIQKWLCAQEYDFYSCSGSWSKRKYTVFKLWIL